VSVSLNITTKYQITEMTFEWQYPVIPYMFARAYRFRITNSNL